MESADILEEALNGTCRKEEAALEGSPSPLRRLAWDCDVTTVARGVDECNALLRRGWRIFDTFGIDEVRIRPRPGLQERRQVMVYYILGRTYTEETTDEIRVEVETEASEAAAAAEAPAAEPEEPQEEAKTAPAQPEEPKPLMSRSRRPARPGGRAGGPARRSTARAAGARGTVETEGIRTS